MEIDIQIEKRFQDYLEPDWLKQVVEQCLTIQNISSAVELSLLITDDETVRKLNRTYRGIDEVTDVLSFAFMERKPDDDSPPFVMPPDGILRLGEIIISYPQAARQAEENQQKVEKEVALLIVHSVLHLLGYEHDEPVREKEMRELEEKVLGQVEKLTE